MQSPAEPFHSARRVRLRGCIRPLSSVLLRPLKGQGLCATDPLSLNLTKILRGRIASRQPSDFWAPTPRFPRISFQVATHALLRHRCADSIASSLK